MPKIKSAIKRVEVAERNRLKNKSWKSAIRTVRNKVDESLKTAQEGESELALSEAYSVIDSAVSKGILHLNAASRRKSSLAKKLAIAKSNAG